MTTKSLKITHKVTREVVKVIDVTCYSEHKIEKILRGMLINLNRDEYFVDESEDN